MPKLDATFSAPSRFTSQRATKSTLCLSLKNAGICFFDEIKPTPRMAARSLAMKISLTLVIDCGLLAPSSLRQNTSGTKRRTLGYQRGYRNYRAVRPDDRHATAANNPSSKSPAFQLRAETCADRSTCRGVLASTAPAER